MKVAGLLRVSTKSSHQWYHAGEAGGAAALASKGPDGSVCKLDEEQLTRLRAALDAGPAVHGWEEDQRWTLKRVVERGRLNPAPTQGPHLGPARAHPRRDGRN